MNLVIHGTEPMRVLTGPEGFKSCQENRPTVVADGVTDIVHFAALMADEANTITPFEETAEGIESALEWKKSEEREWRNNELVRFDALVNTKEDAGLSAAAERAFRIVLRDYPQQVGFPDNDRPEFSP